MHKDNCDPGRNNLFEIKRLSLFIDIFECIKPHNFTTKHTINCSVHAIQDQKYTSITHQKMKYHHIGCP
jgi:hypothetical protein